MTGNQFKFCPKCGGGLKPNIFKGITRSYICQSCRYTFHQNPKPCVSAIFYNEGKVLLTKRKYSPYQGLWDLPGGFVENGERPEDAIKREIQEELGVKIKIKRMVGTIIDPIPGGDYALTLGYECNFLDNNLTPTDDILEFKWFNLSDIPSPLAFESPKKFLDDYRKLIVK